MTYLDTAAASNHFRIGQHSNNIKRTCHVYLNQKMLCGKIDNVLLSVRRPKKGLAPMRALEIGNLFINLLMFFMFLSFIFSQLTVRL